MSGPLLYFSQENFSQSNSEPPPPLQLKIIPHRKGSKYDEVNEYIITYVMYIRRDGIIFKYLLNFWSTNSSICALFLRVLNSISFSFSIAQTAIITRLNSPFLLKSVLKLTLVSYLWKIANNNFIYCANEFESKSLSFLFFHFSAHRTRHWFSRIFLYSIFYPLTII